jgi:hypothetical protein
MYSTLFFKFLIASDILKNKSSLIFSFAFFLREELSFLAWVSKQTLIPKEPIPALIRSCVYIFVSLYLALASSNGPSTFSFMNFSVNG